MCSNKITHELTEKYINRKVVQLVFDLLSDMNIIILASLVQYAEAGTIQVACIHTGSKLQFTALMSFKCVMGKFPDCYCCTCLSERR
jgi:hypothetical protein